MPQPPRALPRTNHRQHFCLDQPQWQGAKQPRIPAPLQVVPRDPAMSLRHLHNALLDICPIALLPFFLHILISPRCAHHADKVPRHADDALATALVRKKRVRVRDHIADFDTAAASVQRRVDDPWALGEGVWNRGDHAHATCVPEPTDVRCNDVIDEGAFEHGFAGPWGALEGTNGEKDERPTPKVARIMT